MGLWGVVGCGGVGMRFFFGGVAEGYSPYMVQVNVGGTQVQWDFPGA